MFLMDVKLIVWSAHEFSTTQEAFRDLVELIESSAMLTRRVKHIHRGNGDEAIELNGGCRLKFKARTKTGGRGLTAPKLILDEGFALRASHVGSLLPTIAALPDPQVVTTSSAGMVESEILRDDRDRGRAGSDAHQFYIEFCDNRPGECATEDCDHAKTAIGCAADDIDRLAAANPALGRRIMVPTLRALRRKMPSEEFVREFLGWWDEPAEKASDLTVELWLSATTEAAPAGRLHMAVDVAPSHRWASVAVCGAGVIELLDRRRGSSWLPERVAQLVRDHDTGPVTLDPAGPAGALIPDLERAGVVLDLLDGKSSVRACGALAEHVKSGRITHRADDATTEAVAGAARRRHGDGWKWARVGSDVDISPLVAATWAAWAWVSGQSADYDVLDSAY
ncbi:MAG: hypothetical protein IPJ61_21740 [Tessaracoccus sp.]|uniref:hypothetical protein n=1 Tax=Tessaracoccus sp. TaxID=1971211 RepID=UPI001EB1E3D6|nr:hypothetical protein [Tessaracoccus sp.]MBK7823613.1 hypothetical protein [Tessaracoccus sp.]